MYAFIFKIFNLYVIFIAIFFANLNLKAENIYNQTKLLNIETKTKALSQSRVQIFITALVSGSIEDVIYRFDPQNWSEVSHWFVQSQRVDQNDNPLPKLESNSAWSNPFREFVKFKIGSIFIAETDNYLWIDSIPNPSQNIIHRWNYHELGAKKTTHVIFGDLPDAILVDDGFIQIEKTKIENIWKITLLKVIEYQSKNPFIQITLNEFTHKFEHLVITDMVKDMAEAR